jgi:hypothetical protein
MLDNLQQQDSNPNYEGLFIGTVIVNDDPTRCERVKVAIPRLFVGEPDSLPWVGKKKTELFPAARDGSYGTFGLVPALGTQVIVSFQQGNPAYGMYEATPHQANERVAEALANYLFRYGWKDPGGNLFMVDTVPGGQQLLVQMASGTVLQIDNSGKVSITGATDINVTTPGKVRIVGGGGVEIN